MDSMVFTKSNKFKAFSLVELSIVILVISILVAGVIGGSILINKSKLFSARALTNSSPVASTKNLVAWWESTSEKSFNISETGNNLTISTWYDINPQSSSLRNATTSTNKPTYSEKNRSGLPMLYFNGSAYFNIPNYTVPNGDADYTVFFVTSTTSSGGRKTVLCGGTWGVTDISLFRYFGTVIENYTGSASVRNQYESSGSPNPKVEEIHIHSFTYSFKNSSNRFATVHLNGALRQLKTLNTTGSKNTGSISDNYIGFRGTEPMQGYIGEIIIFDRALTNSERKSIEGYLSQKWGIRIS